MQPHPILWPGGGLPAPSESPNLDTRRSTVEQWLGISLMTQEDRFNARATGLQIRRAAL